LVWLQQKVMRCAPGPWMSVRQLVSFSSSAPSATWSPGAYSSSATGAIGRRGDGVLHLHGLHHGQRLALGHRSPALTANDTTLPGMGAVRRPGLRMRLAGMGQQVDHCRICVAPCGQTHGRSRPAHTPATVARWPANCTSSPCAVAANCSVPDRAAHAQVQCHRRAGSSAGPGCGSPWNSNAKRRTVTPVRAPAVAAAEGVGGFGWPFHPAGPAPQRRPPPAAGPPAPGGTARPVRAGSAPCPGWPLRKRRAAHHMAQELHIGGQAHDVGLASASSSRARACSRVSPCTMSLAIMES
jgi:hypothetical protein